MRVSSLGRGARLALLVAVPVVVAALLMITAAQMVTLHRALADWHAWAPWLWWIGLGLVLSLGTGALARLLFPPVSRAPPVSAPDEARLHADISRWGMRGVDVVDARGELEELARRRENDTLYVSVHGEISTGKSSLIAALVPDAAPEVDVLGGTTRAVTRHLWAVPGGGCMVLADAPGFGTDGVDDGVCRDEAVRAHVVVFVCEGDLTRSQWRELAYLRELGKPLVVAVNKSDAYSRADRAALRRRLDDRLGGNVPVVLTVAGGYDTVRVRDADGNESERLRERSADVRELRRALQRVCDAAPEALALKRDRAVFLLTARKLEGAVRAHRRDAAEALVARYSRRAMAGAMAAVAPGSDLVIQGTLATGLVRELCALHDIGVREVDLDAFVAGLRRRAGNATPLLLGVAGNALKAFPGLGTLSGGVVHAVAYGLLFRTAGSALVDSLEARGELGADDALRRFEESLRDDMETPARALARVAIERDGLAGDRREPTQR